MALQFRGEIIFEQVGDQGFVYDQEHEVLFSANGSGRLILECIEKGNATSEQIAQEIVSQYEVDKATAERDLADFLKSLTEKKILK